MRRTLSDLFKLKNNGEHFTMVTAYDYTSAQLVERSGIPVVLVGDSLGMVFAGHETTLPVTLEDMIYHCRAVVRGTRSSLIVGDLPFNTYPDAETGLRSSARLLQEAGVQAVKLEGGREVAPIVAKVVSRGIPVMGHLGFTPQSVHAFGSKIVRGKNIDEARALLDDARALQEAGCFAVVLECVPAALAQEVTEALAIPTIGIGSGPHCDGQVQVWHDMLGLYTDFVPRHVKRYARLAETIEAALKSFDEDVRHARFPAPNTGPRVKAQVLEQLRAERVEA